MKKLFFFLAASTLMLLAGNTAKAQLYFGGSIGLTTSTMKSPDNTTTSGVSFKLSPEVGYQFNDKMAAGGTLSYQRGLATLGAFDLNDLKGFITAAAGTQTDLGNTRNNGSNRFNVFRIAPYFRYYIIETRRFNLFVDGVIGYSTINQQSKNAGVWADNNHLSMFDLGARPGFMLKFDGGHFAVIGHLGNLGLQTLTNRDQQGSTTSITRFGLDVDTNNLSLGFIYML